MYLHVNDNRLLQTYKTTCTNIEGLIKIELNPLPVYGNRYMETIKRTFDDQIYTFFCGLDMAEDVQLANFLQSFLVSRWTVLLTLNALILL